VECFARHDRPIRTVLGVELAQDVEDGIELRAQSFNALREWGRRVLAEQGANHLAGVG
jgi:hypothetical protein